MKVGFAQVERGDHEKDAAVVLLSAAVGAIALAQSPRPVDEFTTSAGPVRITMINHATMMIEGGGQVIQVDPVGAQRYGRRCPRRTWCSSPTRTRTTSIRRPWRS